MQHNDFHHNEPLDIYLKNVWDYPISISTVYFKNKVIAKYLNRKCTKRVL